MLRPPDPEMRSPAAANGRAKSQIRNEPHQLSEAVFLLQAKKLRRLYSFCHATACTIASLAWGVAR
jgi:hypothetical protein